MSNSAQTAQMDATMGVSKSARRFGNSQGKDATRIPRNPVRMIYYTILYYMILYYTILYNTMIYCNALYYTII